jgi:hypothetical protein
MALNATVDIDVIAVLSAARDMGSASAPLAKRAKIVLANGVLANQADVIWADTRTVAPSATDALDLAGGGLVDALGVAFAPLKVKMILVVASGVNANPVQLVRPASNGVPFLMAAGDGISLLPGAAFCWVSPSAAGVPITAGTGDLLNIINGGAGTSVDYDIMIIGTSA